ncbi:glutamate ABC transporter substrate-binding protein [Prauserella muralis]|uniref:ABC transporter substrate-binding protein n=1 Tax=Prauserella muralis TaxID=588067 RepID=A0A2V4B8H7_9PSEU|nr:glutamate ABC transporter substrate-binding protein [Prauserella muralis]PXY31351.1 ABC transporter substrate-binding protein [Prauserella muralis]TWE14327.1 amino acid ABC transporter substrate-binding protein (PAAT family) [Prauserella muralis]
MRNPKRHGVPLLLLALLLAACGSPGAPVDPAPVGSVRPPMPANAAVETAVEDSGSAEENCDPTASLAPNPSVPAGSTMDAIRDRGHLVVGVDQNTFLFGFRNPTTGMLEGFDIDIAKEIARELLGDPEAVQFKAITSAQRIPALKNGEVDLVVRTFSVTCERLQEINFSTVYYVAGQRVLVEKNSKVDGVEDLGGKRVCAAKASTSLKNIANAEPKPIPVSVDDWSDCLVMLQQGQVEAVSTDDTILAGMAEQDPTTKIVGERFTDELYGIGIPKENGDMVRYVNAVLEKVRNGPWQSSYNRWLLDRLGPASPPAPTYQ